MFTARPSFKLSAWLPQDPAVLGSLSGAALVVAGALPILVSRGVTDRRALELLGGAGFLLPSDLRIFDEEEDYIASLRDAPERLVLQHVHAADEVEPSRYWISRELLAFLNNKANLPELVPEEFLPPRVVLSGDWATQLADGSFGLPLVLKVASDDSSGGGYGIRICRLTSDVRSASQELAHCPAIVVEEFLPIRRTFCVQFAASRDHIRYLGAPEEVVDESGRYEGSWLEPSRRPPDDVVRAGVAVMDRAVALGYRGIAGFDVAQLESGRTFVLDLNFRVNGSTPPLLVSDAIAERSGARVMLSFSAFAETWDDLVRITDAGLERQHVVPLTMYRPPHGGQSRARLFGMILGASRGEVAERYETLRREGLTAGAAPASDG